MSDVNNDIIRSLLNELINKVNETKGDRNIQKQNDKIISALNDVKNSIDNTKIDTEKLVNELSDKISSKINKVIEETSAEEIQNLKEIDKTNKHENRIKEDNAKSSNRTINPNATEENANKVDGGGRGKPPSSENDSSGGGKGNGTSKWAIAAEFALATAGVAIDELHKGLDSTFKSYNALSEAGNNFNGSALEMRKSAYDSGMTLEQFTKTVSTSNASFKILNTDTIVRFNKAVSDAANSNTQLSLTTEQRNDYEQDYINVLAAQGKTAKQSTKDTQDGFIDLVKQSRQLSSVFGESAESIAKKATEFLNSQEGFVNVISMMRNRENAQEFTSVAQSMGRQLQLPENLQNAIMNFASSGFASQDLIKFMGQSQGSTQLVHQMVDVLKPIAQSTEKFDITKIGPSIANAYSNISKISTPFDRVNNETRGEMAAYRNPQYEAQFITSNAARAASILNPEDILSKANSINANGDIIEQNAQNAYNNKNINEPRSQDTVQTTALVSFRETTKSFEDAYKNVTDNLGKHMNDLTDKIIDNTGAVGKAANMFDKSTSKIIDGIMQIPGVSGGAGVGLTLGHVLADAVGPLIGTTIAGRIAVSGLRNMHSSGGGKRGFIRDMSRLPRMFGSAKNTEEAAEGVAKSGIGSKILKAGKFGAKLTGEIGVPLGFALQGYNMLKDYTGGDKENLKKDTAGMGNLAAATATGALLGSVIPFAGTAVGAGVGFTVGELANAFGADKWLSDNIQTMNHPGSIKKDIDKNKEIVDNIKDKNQIKPHKINDFKEENKKTQEENDKVNKEDEQENKQNDLDSIMENVQEIVNLLKTLTQTSGNIHSETETQNNLLYDQFTKLNNKPQSVVRINKIQ